MTWIEMKTCPRAKHLWYQAPRSYGGKVTVCEQKNNWLVSDSPHATRYELATNSEIFLNYGTIRVSQVVLGIKSPSANAQDRGLIPVLGRSAEEGHDNPLNYSCLENPMERWAWWLPSNGLQRLGCNWSDLAHSTHMWDNSGFVLYSFNT